MIEGGRWACCQLELRKGSVVACLSCWSGRRRETFGDVFYFYFIFLFSILFYFIIIYFGGMVESGAIVDKLLAVDD